MTVADFRDAHSKGTICNVSRGRTYAHIPDHPETGPS